MIEEANKKILLDSINAARGFGQCMYSDGMRNPMCVVGQIAVRVGVTPEQLDSWFCGSWGGKNEPWFTGYATNVEKVLDFEKRVGVDFYELQKIWDRNELFGTEEAARDAMRQLVEGL